MHWASSSSGRRGYWSSYDLINEQMLNAILYANAKGTPLELPAMSNPSGEGKLF